MRKVQYPIGTILVEAENAYTKLVANIESFTVFGYNHERSDVFRQDIDTAKAIPDNVKTIVDLKESTNRKNEVLDECFNWCINTKLRAKFAFGVKSEEYDLFPVKELYEARDSEEKMFLVMTSFIDIAKKKGMPLSKFGQTPEVLSEGENLKEELYSLNAKQEMKKKEKRETTKDRHEVYIRIYDTINQINEIGRNIFANDPGKLELFKSPWPKRTVAKEIAPE